jgi:hypothetical protein
MRVLKAEVDGVKSSFILAAMLSALALPATTTAQQNPSTQNPQMQNSAVQNSTGQTPASQDATKRPCGEFDARCEGQTPVPYKYPPAVSKDVPRAADGHPDLTGVWQGGSNRIGTWEDTNNGEGFLGQSGPITPYAVPGPQQRPPYQEWAAKKVLESYKMRGVDEPMVRCLPPGVPRTTLMGLFPMQIVQTPKTVVMLFEVFHLFRVIPIDAKHPDDLDPSFMGDSVGHWEGDTLVVDVTGFNDKTWLSGVGTFHSEKLHVVEKFTRVDLNTIVYEDTVEDPVVLTGPWTRHGTIMLRPTTRLREYECVENNVDMQRYENMLKDPSLFMRK